MQLFGHSPSRQPARSKKTNISRTKYRARLGLEALEDRLVLSANLPMPDLLFAPDTPQFYIDQFQHADESSGAFAEFQLNGRFGSTATNGGTGGLGNPVTVTWSILRDGVNIQGFAGEASSASNLVGSFRAIYGIANNPADTNYQGEAWFEAIESAFDRWSEVSGINYVYEPNDDGATFVSAAGVLGVRGDVRIGGHRIDGNFGTLAYNFFPSTSDMVIDTADSFYSNTGGNSLRLRNVIAHELGHGLGLSHVESNNAAFLLEPFASTAFDGPQFDDILGAHRNYGDANESGGGNDTVSTATSLGTIGDGQSIRLGEDATDAVVAASDINFVSIDDDSDVDYFSFTVTASSTVDLTLTPLGPTYNQGPQGGGQSSFNSAAQNNLALAVFSSNGSTILASANNTGTGGTESLTNVALAGAGTYFVRVTGVSNAAQFYQLDLSVEHTAPANPGVTVTQSGGSTSVTEGGNTDTYTIVLDSQPTANVTVNINSGTQLSTNPGTLTFTSSNWNIAQTVTVSAIDDSAVEGNHSGTITHSVTSLDGGYNNINVSSVNASITDNDFPPTPGVTIVQSGGSTSVAEGGNTDTYTIVLDSQPTSNVTVNLNSGSQLSTSTSTLVFTTENWNDTQPVTVSAIDDSAVEGNHSGTITHSVSSTDGGYNGIGVNSVTASITDNDNPPPPPSNPVIYFTVASTVTYGGVTFQNEDIGAFDGTSYSLIFDGSDVGAAGLRIDAFDIINDTDILISFDQPTGSVDDSDILLFRASSLGNNTSGLFYWYFDASDVGLTSGGEDVDAITLLSDGSLLLSTNGSGSVSGLSFRDEDVIRFVPTALGSFTAGSFQMFLDGSNSNVGLSQSSGEDINGLAVRDGNLYLTTIGNFSVPGISGGDDDIFVFNVSTSTYESALFANFPSNDIYGIDFAGIASTNGLGLPGGISGGVIGFTLDAIPAFNVTSALDSTPASDPTFTALGTITSSLNALNPGGLNGDFTLVSSPSSVGSVPTVSNSGQAPIMEDVLPGAEVRDEAASFRVGGMYRLDMSDILVEPEMEMPEETGTEPEIIEAESAVEESMEKIMDAIFLENLIEGSELIPIEGADWDESNPVSSEETISVDSSILASVAAMGAVVGGLRYSTPERALDSKRKRPLSR